MVLEESELGIHADLGAQGLQGGVGASGKSPRFRAEDLSPTSCLHNPGALIIMIIIRRFWGIVCLLMLPLGSSLN